MKILFHPLYLTVLFALSVACGGNMKSARLGNQDSDSIAKKANSKGKGDKDLLAYYDDGQQKKWVHTTLSEKSYKTDNPQRWRPRNETLAKIYQNVLDDGKVSPVAVYNAFRFFEDYRGKIQSTEVCTSVNFPPKDFEKLELKKSIIRVQGNGYVDAKVCWNVRHQLREDAIAIADYTNIRSDEERMIVVDLNRDSENITQFVRVSHGMKSGSVADYATEFSNEVSSHKSSQGYYAGYTRYNGANGESLRLLGLSGTNSEAYNRNIVIHAASYVKNGGRSHGCPAVESGVLQNIFDSLEDGRFIPDWYDYNKVDRDYVSLGGLLYVYDGQEIYRKPGISVASL